MSVDGITVPLTDEIVVMIEARTFIDPTTGRVHDKPPIIARARVVAMNEASGNVFYRLENGDRRDPRQLKRTSLEVEGVGWARGWDDETAAALQAAHALHGVWE